MHLSNVEPLDSARSPVYFYKYLNALQFTTSVNYLFTDNFLTNLFFISTIRQRGHAVMQLVEALRYKLEGRGLHSRWCQWNFSLTQSFRPHYGHGSNKPPAEMSTRDNFLGVKAAGV